MNNQDLQNKLDELWTKSHSESENPTASFIEYCKTVLDAYRSHILDSETAGYKLCGEFNPGATFKETAESEEIMDIACDLELPGGIQSANKTIEDKWRRIEELVRNYEDSFK